MLSNMYSRSFFYLETITGTDSIEEQLRILNKSEEGLSVEAKEYLANLKSSVKSNLRGYKILYGKTAFKKYLQFL